MLIDGTIGELSPFHQTFGYYGHGVGPTTAILPLDWQDRLVELANPNTNGVRGLCLSPVDIAYSKLAAGRPKDLDYCRELLRAGLVDGAYLGELTMEAVPRRLGQSTDHNDEPEQAYRGTPTIETD